MEQLDKKETSLERMLMALPIVFATPGARNSEHRSSIKGRYWHFVDNLKPETGKTAEFFLMIALPQDRPGQKVGIEKIDPEPLDIVDDPQNGNKILIWHQDTFERDGMVTMHYDFEISVSEIRHELDPGKSAPYRLDSPDYERYTVSEPWIEITPEIRAKALDIAGGETNPVTNARNIFNWVIHDMSYEYPAMADRGSQKAFAKRKGDCGEFSVVYCALCRAVGIPARTVTCCWLTGSGHQWAEILLPPYGWVPVDTSVAQMFLPGYTIFTPEETAKFAESRGFTRTDPDYLFGNLYPNRLIVSAGNNIEVRSRKAGIDRTFRFMQPGGGAAYPEAAEFRGFESKPMHTGFYIFGDGRSDAKAAWNKAELDLAEAYFHAGLLDKAEPGLRRKTANRPDDATAWLTLGQFDLARGNVDAAIEAFRKSLEGKAGSVAPVLHAWARNLLGNCFDLKGNREAAIAQYQTVIDSGITFEGASDYARKHMEQPFTNDEQ